MTDLVQKPVCILTDQVADFREHADMGKNIAQTL